MQQSLIYSVKLTISNYDMEIFTPIFTLFSEHAKSHTSACFFFLSGLVFYLE